MSTYSTKEEFPFIILKKASIRPEKIVYYTQFIRRDKFVKETISSNKKKEILNELLGNDVKKNLPETNKHEFEISKKASSRIKEKISWLYNLAKKQTITTHTGKQLAAFKMNFITLTLPSQQIHTTDIINKDCLAPFLNECSKQFGMKNYVWRVEFQKNGNAHYHIATDTYIEYWRLKRIWNRTINKLGYVDRYTEKMNKLTFTDYYKMYHNSKNEDYKLLRERYNAGIATGWKEPNSVDCKNVTSSKNIGFYIAKYITKKSDANFNSIVAARENNASNIRLWFCSRSLSKLTKIEIFLEEVNELSDYVLNNISNARTFITDYCTLTYYNLTEQTNEFKRKSYQLFHEYANDCGYWQKV